MTARIQLCPALPATKREREHTALPEAKRERAVTWRAMGTPHTKSGHQKQRAERDCAGTTRNKQERECVCMAQCM